MDAAEPDEIVVFGPFRLDTVRRRLGCGAETVQLGGRAMDLLLALAARKGRLVSKQELFAAAWPNACVHEANLKVTIASLRRALRHHAPSTEFINTVVGRGYWLGGDAVVEQADTHPESAGPAVELPEIARIVGRDAEIAEVEALLASHRLVTIAGPGGIGKTTVAISAARRWGEGTGAPVTFVDLSRVTGNEFVAASLAAALGVSSGGDSLQAIVSILARQKALLVLDTCEHVLSAVAHIAEVLLARTHKVRILATSRQLLRAPSEKVLWLAPLALPPEDHCAGIAEVLRYAALELLVARAFEKGGYIPQDGDAAGLASICRRLDGSPLAIELVAPRVASQGAAAVLNQLEDRFLVMRREGRRGPQRHQTLLVTLRWSYALLTEQEAAVLRALSIFAGPFGAEAAIQVAANAGLSPIEIVDGLTGLRSKSMLAIDRRGEEPRYRLLDTTRIFAAGLLDMADEKPAVSSGHARHILDMLGRAAADQPDMPPGQWRKAHLGLIDDLRKAIDWTLFRSADPLLGIKLVAAGLPLWRELSLGEEIRANCDRALSEFRRMRSGDAMLELKLVVGSAAVSTYLSTDPERASALFQTAVALARDTGDPQAECRAIGAFATYELMRGRRETVADALKAMRAAAIRANRTTALWEEEQLRAQYEIRTCAFGAALARVQRLSQEMRGEAEHAVPQFQIHQRLNVAIQTAALHWLTGRPGEAVRVANLAAAEAREIDHGLTLIHCLAQGIVWTLVQCGEYPAVLPHIDALRRAIYRHGMAAWIPVADSYAAAIAAFLGNRPDPACLRSAFYGVRAGMTQIRHDARYAMLAEAMLANGQPGDAAEVVRHVFATSSEPWGRCELLRLRAATERAAGRDRSARETLVEALRAAEESGSLAWELRSAHDLAALLRDSGEAPEARRVLAPVYRRFPDDFETRDLRNVRRLLSELA